MLEKHSKFISRRRDKSQCKSDLAIFINASAYTAPVDIKKLKFIFSAIEDVACSKKMNIMNLNILEVACGKGGITLSLASLGCQVRAFDIDKDSVETVQSQIEQKGINNLVVTVDNGYTFDDGRTYDVVIASEVFEHVIEPEKFLENIVRRMTEGSCLLLTTPNGYGPYELMNRLDPRTYLRKWNSLRHLFGKHSYTYGSGKDHCQFYTKQRLIKMFSNLSLRQVNICNSDSFLALLSPLRENNFWGNIDIKLADVLPYWLASGWYFVFELHESNGA